MEPKRKDKRKKGLFGVKSTVKLFSFRGELWSDDDDSSDEDVVFKISKDEGKKTKEAKSTTRTNGSRQEVPKADESEPASTDDAPVLVGDSTEDEAPKSIIRPRITFKMPSKAELAESKKRKKKKRLPEKVSPSKPRQRKKEPYYETETQELQMEAECAMLASPVEKSGSQVLKIFLRENKVQDVDYILPDELLVKIFKSLIASDPKQTLHNLMTMCQVCESWRQLVIKSQPLWKTLDLGEKYYTGIESDLLNLFRASDGQKAVESLNLSSWVIISEETVNMLVNHLGEKLKSINFRECHNMTQNCLQLLGENCPVLESINLSRTSYTNFNPAPRTKRTKKKGEAADKGQNSNPLQTVSFKNFIMIVGQRLRELNLSDNKLPSFSVIIGAILENCPNLTLLDLSNVETSSSTVISVDKLHASCPKLKVLRLANITLSAAHRSSAGFVDLEELVIPVQGEAHSVGHSDNVLGALTDKAENLKQLDIRGSKTLSVSSLIKIPSWNLEHLSLAYCTKLHTPDLELALGKWKQSLIDLDLSWNINDESVAASLEALAMEDNSQLKTMQLRGSAVSFKNVKRLLTNCKKMVSIDLQSCRGLPRGIKRLYEGDDFVKFCEDVKNGHYDFD